MEKAIPILNKRIFWDTDFSKLDYEGHAVSIIERVFERGDVEDIRQVRRFYGDEKVKDVLLKVKYLPDRRMYLAAAIAGINVEELKCYTQVQSMRELWPY